MATAKKKSSKTASSEKSEKPKIKLVTKIQKFKGQKMFSIWEVDRKTGEPVKDFPVISIGYKKAKALLKFGTELKDYVAKVEAENSEESDE